MPIINRKISNISIVWLIPGYALLSLSLLPVYAIAAVSIAQATFLGQKLCSENKQYSVQLHSLFHLENITVDNVKISELSGLAWDEDEQLLYALSDNGALLHLRLVEKDGVISDIQLVAGHALQDEKGKPLRFRPSDSEGLSIIQGNNHISADTRLIVSFERIPRLIEYQPDGVLLRDIPLPDPLADIKNYRSENKSLEAVTFHERFGIITGPEFPLSGQPEGNLDLYSLNGLRWSFAAYNSHHGALVDMTGMADGSVLALERVYGGLFPYLEITLHRFVLGVESSSSEIIYTFRSGNGIIDDNFEGITHYRDDRYFMISDDNNHPLKQTMLLYFSIAKGC